MIHTRTLTSTITPAAFLLAVAFNPAANAEIIDVIGLNGHIDPITYTDINGTFTTSAITLGLLEGSSSFLDHNTNTGELVSHIWITASFNDGKTGGGSDLTGVLNWSTAGISPGQDIPFSTTGGGVLDGAGAFDGTEILGSFYENWHIWIIQNSHTWTFDTATGVLPPGFFGDPVVLTGEFEAILVPAPNAMLVLGLAFMGSHRRRPVKTTM